MRLFHDIGHGGNNIGIEFGGIVEKDFILGFVKDLVPYLSKFVDAQLFSRSSDKDLNFIERAAIAEKWDADLVISHHINGAFFDPKETSRQPTEYKEGTDNTDMVEYADPEPNPKLNGLLAFATAEDIVGQQVASAIMRAAPLAVRRKSTEYYEARPGDWTHRAYNAIRRYHCPAVLVEHGHATNSGDLAALQSLESRPAFAASLAAGIGRFAETP